MLYLPLHWELYIQKNEPALKKKCLLENFHSHRGGQEATLAIQQVKVC